MQACIWQSSESLVLEPFRGNPEMDGYFCGGNESHRMCVVFVLLLFRQPLKKTVSVEMELEMVEKYSMETATSICRGTAKPIRPSVHNTINMGREHFL